jgi:integrase
MTPGLLSKQIGRLLRQEDFTVRKMHALRHGFASWQLIRYLMLVDRQFRQDVRVGRFHLDLDGRHEWFSDSMLADLAEVFGGILWRNRLEEGGSCIGNATDLVVLSKLLGHANRFTTLENYTNSLGWICRYFLRRREMTLMGRK